MNILIADDHDLVRDAIASLISRDDPQAKVLLASDYQQAAQILADGAEIDLVLLDVNMPGMNNLDGLSELVTAYPQIPIAMISGIIKRNEVQRSFALGAKGFIPKTMNGNALLSVLKMIINGTKYVPEIILQEPGSHDDAPHTDLLSQRETEVLQELFKGHSNKLIAKNLYIEETTVKLHLRSLFNKLGANNRTEVVIKAIKAGFSPQD